MTNSPCSSFGRLPSALTKCRAYMKYCDILIYTGAFGKKKWILTFPEKYEIRYFRHPVFWRAIWIALPAFGEYSGAVAVHVLYKLYKLVCTFNSIAMRRFQSIDLLSTPFTFVYECSFECIPEDFGHAQKKIRSAWQQALVGDLKDKFSR